MNMHENARLTPRGRERMSARSERADAGGRRHGLRGLPEDGWQVG